LEYARVLSQLCSACCVLGAGADLRQQYKYVLCKVQQRVNATSSKNKRVNFTLILSIRHFFFCENRVSMQHLQLFALYNKEQKEC
jgi:hypothetical protein